MDNKISSPQLTMKKANQRRTSLLIITDEEIRKNNSPVKINSRTMKEFSNLTDISINIPSVRIDEVRRKSAMLLSNKYFLTQQGDSTKSIHGSENNHYYSDNKPSKEKEINAIRNPLQKDKKIIAYESHQLLKQISKGVKSVTKPKTRKTITTTTLLLKSITSIDNTVSINNKQLDDYSINNIVNNDSEDENTDKLIINYFENNNDKYGIVRDNDSDNKNSSDSDSDYDINSKDHSVNTDSSFNKAVINSLNLNNCCEKDLNSYESYTFSIDLIPCENRTTGLLIL